jgi:hypothetical protein
MLDFKSSCNLLGPGHSDVGDGHKASAGYQASDVFRVASAHFPHPEYADSQLTHGGSSPKAFAL